MTQAKEALKFIHSWMRRGVTVHTVEELDELFYHSRKKIESALAQSPVNSGKAYGYLYTTAGATGVIDYFSRERCNEYMRNDPWTETPLYASNLRSEP